MADDFIVVDGTNWPANGDFETIQEALAYVEGTGVSASIFVRAGTYNLVSAVSVPAGTRIIGESRESVVVDCQHDHYNFVVTSNDVVIENLYIVNCTDILGAIHFSGASNSEVRGCKFYGGTRAVTFEGATFCRFSENLCWDQSIECVYINETATDNRVFCNRITDTSHYGIRVQGAFNKITDNTMSGCEYDGILISAASNSIRGNTCNHNENGIYVALEEGDHNLIIGNVCRENRGYGINVNSLDNNGNVVLGNTARGNVVADLRHVPGNWVAFNDAETVV